MSCAACKLTVGDDAFSCDGPCGSCFHVSCLDLPRDCIKELRRNPQLLWMCTVCTAARCTGQGTTPPRDALAVELRNCLSSELAASFNGLRNELLGEIKSALASATPAHHLTQGSIDASLQPRPATQPWFTHAPALTSAPSKRRLVDRSPPPTANAQPLLIGTGKPTSRALLMVPPAEAMFWLYLTRIAPSVPIADVVAFVREQLGTEDVSVVRLLTKGRELGTLSFVSYKVGLSPELRDKALSLDTWPPGTAFREFHDHGTSYSTVDSFRPKTPAAPVPPLTPAPAPSQRPADALV